MVLELLKDRDTARGVLGLGTGYSSIRNRDLQATVWGRVRNILELRTSCDSPTYPWNHPTYP